MFMLGNVDTFTSGPLAPQGGCNGAPECNRPAPPGQEGQPGGSGVIVGICQAGVNSPCNNQQQPPAGGSAANQPTAPTCVNCVFKIGAIVAVVVVVWWLL